MKSTIVKARSIEEAIEIACEQLGVNEKKLSYKILKKPSSGFLKYFKGDNYEIKFFIKNTKKRLDMKIDNALSGIKNIDGQFIITFNDNNVFLTVYPPGENGKLVKLDDVVNKLTQLKVPKFSIDEISKAIEKASGRPEQVAVVPKDSSRDGYIKLEITEDAQHAYITIFPPKKGGNPIKLEEIMKILDDNKICFGIKHDEIKKHCENAIFHKTFLAAEGIPCINGDDAKLQYYFTPYPKISFTENSKGRVDFKELGIIQNVRADEILAKKIPPTSGQQGITIRNRKVKPIPGKDITIPKGENTYLNSDKTILYAKEDGRVVMRKNAITIEPLFTIENVDYSVGNIDFNGSVVITEKIDDDFKVIASGDIFVQKNVGKCHLESLNGQIIVIGGIMGKDKGLVKADGNITARFAENAVLISKNDVIINKAIMHSRIYAGGEVSVMGDRGLIVGGIVQAKNGIKAKEIGSVSFTKTLLVAGFNPETLQKIAAIEEKISNEMEKKGKFELAIESIHSMIKNGDINMDDEYTQKLQQLENMKNRQDDVLKSLKNEIFELKNHSTIELNAKIRVKNRMFPGVKIEIANEHLNINQEYRFITFYLDHDEHKIKWTGY